MVAIADTFKIPVRLIGVGESVEDLQDFDAKGVCRRLCSNHPCRGDGGSRHLKTLSFNFFSSREGTMLG